MSSRLWFGAQAGAFAMGSLQTWVREFSSRRGMVPNRWRRHQSTLRMGSNSLRRRTSIVRSPVRCKTPFYLPRWPATRESLPT